MSLVTPLPLSVAQQRRWIDFKLRRDLATFIHRTFQTVAPAQDYQFNWHIQALRWRLEQCATGAIKRLLITLPPRYLKSVCASVAFPAWVLGKDPAKRIICASYSENLASRHSADCRAVMQADWYRRLFPQTMINPKKNTELNFETTGHGYRYSTSVGGTLTGRGGNLIIIDDPIKPADAMSTPRRAAVNECFDRTLYSRLDSKRDDVIILIMQRLHVEDLAGYVLAKEPWVHLNLPVIAEAEQRILIGNDAIYASQIGELLHPGRESQTELDQLKLNLGSY